MMIIYTKHVSRMNYSSIIKKLAEKYEIPNSTCKNIVDDFLCECESSLNNEVPLRTKDFRIIPRLRAERTIQNKEGVIKNLPARRYGLLERMKKGTNK